MERASKSEIDGSYSGPNQRTAFMVPIYGGLGNQMFQVAHALARAEDRRATAKFVDLTAARGNVSRNWELECFGIHRTRLSAAATGALRLRMTLSRKLYRFGGANGLGVYHERFFPQEPAFYQSARAYAGYWQGERFFASAEETVRKAFQFRPELSRPSDFDPGLKNSVAVHVRRGDYVSDPKARARHLVCDSDWYIGAIEQMRSHLDQPTFFVFSDDPDWADKALCTKSDVHIIRNSPSAPAWIDMALMAQCAHFIISNSSYSWWAAYLGKSTDSLTIAPANWHPGVPTDSLPIHCPDWTLL